MDDNSVLMCQITMAVAVCLYLHLGIQFAVATPEPNSIAAWILCKLRQAVLLLVVIFSAPVAMLQLALLLNQNMRT